MARKSWITVERERLEKVLNDTYVELRELQKGCKHKHVVKTARSDTGNWCPSDDSYWYTFECPECGKYWTEEQ
jgi:hypothetical protein